MNLFKQKDLEKFYTGLIKLENNCIIWNKGKDKDGYGMFYANGKTYKAHRIAYELATRQFPDKLCVCHSCDNPSCVNPEHLWLGTNSDNVKDRHKKGRSRNKPTLGESHNMAKLSNEDVRHIRSSSFSSRALSKYYEVSEATISNIRNNKRWTHLI